MEKKPNPWHQLIIIPPEQLPPGAHVIDARHIDLDNGGDARAEKRAFGLADTFDPPRARIRIPAGARRRRPAR